MAKNKLKAKNKTEVKNYIDVLYMIPSSIKAKTIADFLKEDTNLAIDLWEDMNVLEIGLPNDHTIVFEPIDNEFKDPSDASFVKNRSVMTIFAMELEENDLPEVKPYFDQIVEKFSGFFCADTDDFKPIYAGSSDKAR